MQAAPDRISLYVLIGYLLLLLGLGVSSRRAGKRTARDFFLAGRTIGPVLLFLSIFGTTMTSFAMVGSTAKAFDSGIGVYGLMASSSGLVHSLVFLLVGLPLWAIGKRYDYLTQIQFFRARFESELLGYVLFPVLVLLIVPYLWIGLLGTGAVVGGLTRGMFPETFPGVLDPATGNLLLVGAVPPWLSGLVVASVVLFYVFLGGVRGAVWANALQTVVFLVAGLCAFYLIGDDLGGWSAATAEVARNAPERLVRTASVSHTEFFSYMLVPLSVGMFPHVFQHWLTARDARSFRLSVVLHPLCILLLWMPCVLIGIWAAGAGLHPPGGNSNAVLGLMVARLSGTPWLSGLLAAGVLAAIMSSLDSQFVCLGTMFSQDVVFRLFGEERFGEAAKVRLGRVFIVIVVACTYALSLLPAPHIFDLGVWCFSGFAGLFPLVVAALYWRRATAAGALASVLAMAGSFGYLFYQGWIGPLRAGVTQFEEPRYLGFLPVVWICLASTLALVLVSCLGRPPRAETVEAFLGRRIGASQR